MVSVETLRGTLDGSGSGYGYGYGSGYGSGSGSGSGYGSGYGYGYGSGYGSGSGSGSGYGYGSGSGEYWLSAMPCLLKNWTAEQCDQFNQFRENKAHLAFWRSGSDGQPSNGGRTMVAAAPGVIHAAAGPLTLCASGTLHATSIPPKWKGGRIWIVVLHGDVIGDHEKWGCLKREILGECSFG